MDLKQIIMVIIFVAVVGIIVYRNWDSIARRNKNKANGKEKVK